MKEVKRQRLYGEKRYGMNGRKIWQNICGEGGKKTKKGRERMTQTLIYTAIGSGNNEEMRNRQRNGGRG